MLQSNKPINDYFYEIVFIVNFTLYSYKKRIDYYRF